MGEQKINVDQVKARLDELALLTAEANYEEALERQQRREAEKAAQGRVKKQRMAQLARDLQDKRGAIRGCSHRQGGGLKRPTSGKGASALRGILTPDKRRLIMCANCPLRVFSPPDADGYPRPRKGETERAAALRVERYQEEKAEFERLWEASQDQLTEEAAQPMDCGTEFDFTDQGGNKAHVPSPCDSYAQGRDNRRDVAA